MKLDCGKFSRWFNTSIDNLSIQMELKRISKYQPHTKFAWYPIKTAYAECVWLEKVYTKNVDYTYEPLFAPQTQPVYATSLDQLNLYKTPHDYYDFLKTRPIS